jgi:UTP--glucose-1-phosphate uridylyltransferase
MTSPQAQAKPDFSAFQRKLERAGASAAALQAFRLSYDRLAAGETGRIPEAEIEPVADLPVAPSHAVGAERVKELLARTALLKLNGGLGTSMGLAGPKSLLPIKEGLTFLDLICRHVEQLRARHGGPAFLLLNSFATSGETHEFIARRYPSLGEWPAIELLQNKVPKVDAATLAPAAAAEPDLEWCPPGHGDLYAALSGSGRLDALIAQGIRYLFVSNADNLGATLDLAILDDFAASGAPFLMEVTVRTAADRKGGHLCRAKADGRLRLREVAQCPEGDLKPFQDIARHRFFNTNNLWLDLVQLRDALRAHGGALPLPVIFNTKTVDPRDGKSARVIQLETAMGAAIEAFPGARAVVVPRDRFMPVKTTNDLLTLRSDAFTLIDNTTLRLAAGGSGAAPLVDLDPAHYRLIDQLDVLTARGIPSLRHCRSLKVEGPMTFCGKVIFCGNITVINATGEEKKLCPGNYCDQQIELGDLKN